MAKTGSKMNFENRPIWELFAYSTIDSGFFAFVSILEHGFFAYHLVQER